MRVGVSVGTNRVATARFESGLYDAGETGEVLRPLGGEAAGDPRRQPLTAVRMPGAGAPVSARARLPATSRACSSAPC